MGFGLADWIYCTYILDSVVITALSLISALYSSPQNPLSLYQPVFTSRSMATASNSGDSSASRAHVFPSSTLVQNYLPTTPSTEMDRHLFSASLAELHCSLATTSFLHD
jgi:hypothetical protein